jgi:hypothetical protein
MNYEEFLNLCEKAANDCNGDGYIELKRRDKKTSWQIQYDTDRIYVEWTTGGSSGASCWNSEPSVPYVSDEPPKELGVLDGILEAIKPDLSFLQYRTLSNNLIKSDSRRESDYYGNCSNYAIKQVNLTELYDYLVKKKWI